jgi:hypothetical protein
VRFYAFNEMFLKEYADRVDQTVIAKLLDNDPYLFIHGQAMQELVINTNRRKLATFIVNYWSTFDI